MVWRNFRESESVDCLPDYPISGGGVEGIEFARFIQKNYHLFTVGARITTVNWHRRNSCGLYRILRVI